MFQDIFLPFSFALCWAQRAGFVDAQAIGSIYTGGGPAIVSQDPNTGGFLYSIYSQRGYGAMQSVKTAATPKNGTAIGLAGWGKTGQAVSM